MTDKVQKIRKEVERLKLCTMDEHMKFYSESAEAEYNALCKVEEIIDSLQEEPVSEDLGEYIDKLSKQFPEVSFAKLSRIAVRVAKWQKEQTMKDAVDGYVIEDIKSVQIIATTNDGKHIMAISDEKPLIWHIVSCCKSVKLKDELFEQCSLKEIMEE